MRSRMGSLILALALLLVSQGDTSAEIYRWTDAQGRLHFTQSLDRVPMRYRDQLRESGPAKRGSVQFYSQGSNSLSGNASGRTIRIPFRQENGLMRVRATVNGHQDIPFYIDTGASGVSIPAAYARRLGIQIDASTRRVQVQTANGLIQVPLVRLDSVKVGSAQVDGLMATINPTMKTGLLGGAFFNNFNYQVDPSASVITLERNHAFVSGLGENYWQDRFREIREPLAELEHFLDTREIKHTRRRELEEKRDELKARLHTLQIEANRDDIPHAWRR